MIEQQEFSVSRRALIAGAAFAGVMGSVVASSAGKAVAATSPSAPDIAMLEREKIELVAPPFVHAHEQIATGAFGGQEDVLAPECRRFGHGVSLKIVTR